jgi:hypothetical protein
MCQKKMGTAAAEADVGGVAGRGEAVDKINPHHREVALTIARRPRQLGVGSFRKEAGRGCYGEWDRDGGDGHGEEA